VIHVDSSFVAFSVLKFRSACFSQSIQSLLKGQIRLSILLIRAKHWFYKNLKYFNRKTYFNF
jgi:hypothetical protein